MTLRRRLAEARAVQPLHERDFALLSLAAAVSLFGDGFFYVALAWQVYEISNVPTALSLVGVAWTLPLVVFLLLGGAFSDRYDRRLLMIGADLLRAGALVGMAVLSGTGLIELWHVAALIALVGIGDAFFNPASTAIVPDLVPEEQLPQANALMGMIRPLMIRLAGPAVAGFVVAAFGAGVAFGVDALTFILSALVLAAVRARPTVMPAAAASVRRTVSEVSEGLRFVRANPWCWATLVAAMLSLLVFFGPVEVLVPFLVKNRLGLGPESLGAIFAMGGVGSVAMALAVGQLGLPRRRITVMYAAWSLGVAVMAVYGLMTSLWQALLASLIMHALFQLGQVIWITLLQQLVPRPLLGRVASLDWLVSTGLVPVSFALTGPAAAAFGADTTMVGAALLGAVFMGMLLFVPGVRDPERADVADRSADVIAPG
ncbi:MAG: MFS transporter [Chloroflexota bacterium]|nr:MFS transporter [Chloroflexota bacterium]